MKELVGKTAYLFLPSIIDIQTPTPNETGFYCPMSQSNSYMVRSALGLDGKTILSPVVHLKHDPDTLALELTEQMGARIGRNRSEIKTATYHALERQDQFQKELYREGFDRLDWIKPHEPVLMVTGRPYNLYDERLNLRLGQNLAKLGLTAAPMDLVDVSSVDLSDFPSMYWGLGATILRAAKYTLARKNYFGLHLTNFGCGADSFIEHFYKHIMGDNPYLILELDEHSGVAGVMTRLEAYKNVIENTLKKSKGAKGEKVGLANVSSPKKGPS